MKAKKIFEEIRNSKVFYSLIGLIILVIFSAIAAPNFRTVDNIITVFRQASVLLVLSAGLTAVLLTGGMDLSVGATAGFIGCICAQCIKNGVPIPAAFILGILIGSHQRAVSRNSPQLYCYLRDQLGHERTCGPGHAGGGHI